MRRRQSNWQTRVAKSILLKTLGWLHSGFLEIACPDQTYSFGDPEASLRGIMAVHDERMFARVLFGGEIGFGESYMDGDWSSPDAVAVLRLVMRNLALFEEENRAFSAASRWWDRLRHRRRRNSPAGSRENIQAHYDLGNEFYRLFLDANMAYSCGYFSTPEDSLDQAQVQKFDRICRKLRMEPRDHVLEIGTGWGGFAAYASTQYGCRITTTTISRRQHDYAADWFRRLGDAGRRIELLFEDYRNLSGRYDKIVSIEMFEAVGVEYYDEFFGVCDRLLGHDGTMLLQTITVPEQRFASYRKRSDWIQKYIFPGAELASVSEILRSLARVTRLSLLHAEDIGAHYARTLELWRQRFLAALPEVRTLGFDERFVRMWIYYLVACEAAFRERTVGDFQLVLTKNLNRRPLLDEPWSEQELSQQARQPSWSPLS
jgi:cyclopropane-fatty-acyl-phospholipid synthase